MEYNIDDNFVDESQQEENETTYPQGFAVIMETDRAFYIRDLYEHGWSSWQLTNEKWVPQYWFFRQLNPGIQINA